MLTVVYVHHRLKSSELCCYVNGKAVMNAEVNLPNTDDVREKEREGGREGERIFIPVCRSMTNAFLEALQVLEKMLCSKVRWQLCTYSESHLDTRPWKHSTNLARATR